MVTVQIPGMLDHQPGGPIQGWPGHQERQRSQATTVTLGMCKGLLFGLYIVEVRKLLRYARRWVDDRESSKQFHRTFCAS